MLLELVLEVVRFILFVISAALGFLVAILILPFPGKTFFNKMYKLPNRAKVFVDDSIALISSFLRVCFSVLSWLARALAIISRSMKQKKTKPQGTAEEDTISV